MRSRSGNFLQTVRARWRLTAAGAVVVLALPVVLLLWPAPGDRGWRPVEHVVGRERAGLVIRQRGIVDSPDATPAVVGVHGRILNIVKQGTAVQAGDVVFSMDPTETRDQIEQQDEALEREQSTLAGQQAYGELAAFQESEDLKTRQASQEYARLVEQTELARPTPEDLRLLQIEKELVELDLADAEDDCRRQRGLQEKEFVTAAAVAPYERRVETARARLEEVEVKIRVRRKGITEERRIELRRAVERAEASVGRARKQMERRLAELQSRVDATGKRLAEARYYMARYQEDLKRAETRAARAGLVRLRTYRDWRSGGRVREYGAGVEKWPQDIIADVIDPFAMRVRLVVNEADYHLLRKGLPVTLSLPAFPGRTFSGRLEQLGAIGLDRNQVDPTVTGGGRSEVMMFSAEISFDGQGTRFQPGMSATVGVTVEEPAERLVVPRQAVCRQGEGFVVYGRREGQYRPVPVRGRFLNETVFAVDDGLAAGDVVLLNPDGGAP